MPPGARLSSRAAPAAAGDQRLAAGLHGAHLGQLVGADRPSPQHAVAASRDEVGAEPLVPGDGTGLEQGLELPGGGPPLPVGAIARQATGSAGRRGPRAAGRRRPGRRHRRCAAPRGPAPRRRRGLVGDEQHVDVARVIELATAELAHADHGEGVAARPAAAPRPAPGRPRGPARRRPWPPATGPRPRGRRARAGRARRCAGARGAWPGPAHRRRRRGAMATGRSSVSRTSSAPWSARHRAGPARWRRPSPPRTPCPAGASSSRRTRRPTRVGAFLGAGAPARGRRPPARPSAPRHPTARPGSTTRTIAACQAGRVDGPR